MNQPQHHQNNPLPDEMGPFYQQDSNAVSCPGSQNHDWSLLQTGLSDMNARRSISDSALAAGRLSSRSRMDTMNLMITRSGGSTVTRMIDNIHQCCSEAARSQHASIQVKSPEEDLCVLAQLAVDSYYKKVIVGRNGIPAIVRAMHCFPSDRGLQECCLLCLANLCTGGAPGNLMAVDQANGVSAIINAMKMFPGSVAVQSAACDALRNLGALLMARVSTEEQMKRELMERLVHAKDMYLMPTHKSTAECLLQALATQQLSPQR